MSQKVNNLNLMYINRGTLLKLVIFGKRMFQFLNKHFYILPLFSILAKVRNNKIFKFSSWMIKIIILVNLILGTGFILYFTDFLHPLNSLYSIYFDMFKPYIELLKTFWNDLINFDNVIEDSYIKNSGDKIKHQIKLGIKEGVKEALD